MSEIKLLPCPFCGSEVYIEDLGVEKGDHYYMMQCTNEDCDAATCFGEKNKEKFIEAWNTRKPMEKIVEQLEKSLLLVATSKEFWNNPQNGEFVEAVISLDTAIEIVKEGGVDGM